MLPSTRLLIEAPDAANKYVDAMKLLHVAAEAKVPQGLHLLGVMCEYGLGVPQNFPLAGEYYAKATDKNFVESMYHLALMYAYGRGYPQDFSRCPAHFNLKAWMHFEDDDGDGGFVGCCGERV